MDDQAGNRTRAMEARQHAALVVLLDRAGGTFSYTESEYQAVLARFGGKIRLNLHIEVIKSSDSKEPSVELRLEEKAPRNAELLS